MTAFLLAIALPERPLRTTAHVGMEAVAGEPLLADVEEVLRRSPHVLELVRGSTLVPVPLHWTRLFRRRYNQSAHLARAVGAATGANPIPIIIPCHRVIGMDGKLHGYGGGEGLPTKEWLLKLEGAVIA